MPEKSTFAPPASATAGLSNYNLEGARARRKKRRKTSDQEKPMTAANSEALKLFIPITKIDAAKRLVYGVATAELPDVTGEVCDYATTKPLYEKWSGEFAKNTDGKSVGNLRAMHGNIAAGKLTSINFNDEAKKIEVCAKVVDDGEWNKCLEGVYTGFSQGGKYIKRWKDPADDKLTRYTAEPVEISLVDSPCLKEATFEVIKADGSTELRKFVKAEPAERSEDKAKYHDEKAKEHVEASNRAEAGSAAAKAHRHAADEHEKASDLHRKAAAHYAADDEENGDKVSKEADAQSDAAETASGQANEASKSAGGNADWEQVWVSKRLPNQQFKTKAALSKALDELDAQAAAQKIAAPVIDALGALKESLSPRKPAGDGQQTVRQEPAAGDGGRVKVSKKDYSDDERKEMADSGEAMKDGSYPIKTKDDLENAIKAYGRAKNKAATKRHIIKRAKALKATDLLPADWSGSTKDKDAEKIAAGDGSVTKGADLWSISDLLLLLDGVSRAEDNAELPSWGFGNSVELPKDLCDRFGAALIELGDIAAEMLDAVLSAMKDGEATEAMALAEVISGLAKLAGDRKRLAKAGAKHSKADKERIGKAHDLLVELDPACCPGTDDDDEDDDAEKLLKTLEAERKAFGSTIDGIMAVVKDVQAQVKAIADQPLPMGHSSVALRVVDKSADFGAMADRIGLSGEEDPLRRLADAAQAAQRR